MLEPLTPVDMNRCSSLVRTYANLNLGIADAAVTARAECLRIARILTVDERHFRAVRSSKGAPFVLLSSDA